MSLKLAALRRETKQLAIKPAAPVTTIINKADLAPKGSATRPTAPRPPGALPPLAKRAVTAPKTGRRPASGRFCS
uniref:Uncharacterized protein n=1 Tax=Tanacetum cinerariifolium TaxID=118510 RepID=A0A699SU13_TANCI|nr:hypothetical protein [Tanacetum cinerariifolium]